MNQRSGTPVRSSSPVRQGSIPMVLIIICCLGIFAVSSIFMTQNTAQLDKKSELNQTAWVVAQAAVEEILLKVANNKVAMSETNRATYLAEATQKYANVEEIKMQSLDGKEAGVEVFSRSLRDPAQNNKLQTFEELMEYLPAFMHANTPNKADCQITGLTVRNNTYNGTWRQQLADPKFDPRFKDLLTAKDIAFNPAQAKDEAATFYQQFFTANGAPNNTATGNAVRTAFDALPVLSKNPPGGMINGEHDTATLTAFRAQWDTAMDAIATHMQNRIDGCNGDFDYAIGAMMTSFARGEPCANDSDAGEETYREGARDSGMTEYTENLLTVATRVSVRKGKVSAVQPYTAQRIVRKMNLETVMQKLQKNTAAYLHSHYNLTAKDMANPILGFILPLASPTAPISLKAEIFTKMNERFSASAGTQIRNVQLATCMGGGK